MSQEYLDFDTIPELINNTKSGRMLCQQKRKSSGLNLRRQILELFQGGFVFSIKDLEQQLEREHLAHHVGILLKANLLAKVGQNPTKFQLKGRK